MCKYLYAHVSTFGYVKVLLSFNTHVWLNLQEVVNSGVSWIGYHKCGLIPHSSFTNPTGSINVSLSKQSYRNDYDVSVSLSNGCESKIVKTSTAHYVFCSIKHPRQLRPLMQTRVTTAAYSIVSLMCGAGVGDLHSPTLGDSPLTRTKERFVWLVL